MNADHGPPEHERAPFREEYDTGDYMMLPHFGVRHYSVPDAAIISAIDRFESGDIELPGFESGVLDSDQVALRNALRPVRSRLEAAMMRSIDAGQLEAVVLRRSIDDGKGIPRHCYIDIEDLFDWLTVYGYEPGDHLANIEQSILDEPWSTAAAVAEDRLETRLGLYKGRSQSAPPREGEIEQLRKDLHASRLHVAQLEQERAAGRTSGVMGKVLGKRERDTLLVMIAALCKIADQDLARGAAPAIAAATAELGASISEDQVRTHLKATKAAIENRSK